MKKKKEGYVDWRTADEFSILILFLSGTVLLNRVGSSIVTNVLGICCFILAVYGMVCFGKMGKFIFDH